MNLIADIGFDHSFSFIYSARPGTPAAELADETPMEVKKTHGDSTHIIPLYLIIGSKLLLGCFGKIQLLRHALVGILNLNSLNKKILYTFNCCIER